MKKVRYIHEDGTPLTAEELRLLGNDSEQEKKQGQPNFIKIWLLVLLTIVVITGVIFTYIEYSQSQQIIDSASKWLEK